MQEYIVHAPADGIADATQAIQAALSSGAGRVVIPPGTYRITEPLRIGSNTELFAEGAHLSFLPGRELNGSDFLLTNADTIGGNANIAIYGGVWDGGYGDEFHVKCKNLFAKEACSGSCLNFVNVHGLKLMDMVIANTMVYHIRMSKLENFEIRNIGFYSEQLAYNQDGLHFGGACRHGIVENIRAITRGQTNDDMIALNADDSMERIENHGLVRDAIEDIVFRNIYAEDCYTAIRLLSVTAPIRNIRIENLHCGCRFYAINMDGARQCNSPLFKEDEFPGGVGRIENVVIDGMEVYFSTAAPYIPALIDAQTLANGLEIHNFNRLWEKDLAPDMPTLYARNLVEQRLLIDGEEVELHTKEASVTRSDLHSLVFLR